VSICYSACILPRNHLSRIRVAEDAEVKVPKGTLLKIVMGLKEDDDQAVGYGWESPV
jgi:hypothetical protein